MKPKITKRKISDYLPDDHNANAGSERGLQMLEDSLSEDGVGRSIVADKNGKIPAGNKTLEAAAAAGFQEVIEIETDGTALIVHKRTDWDLDDPTGSARRYAYRDNRTSELSLNWDANTIAADVAAGVDLSHMFTQPEIDVIMLGAVEPPDNQYSRKVDIPIYEPAEHKPSVKELFSADKTNQLLDEIKAATDITDDERFFLTVAAQRHTVMNFSKIADYYAHGSAHLQRLMENSALVIVDFNRAIELGYVKLTKEISDIVQDETDG